MGTTDSKIGVRFNDSAIVTVLVKDNPKRKGTLAHKKFAAVKRCNGKTVAQLRETWKKTKLPDSAGGELKWCLAREWVSVKMAS